MKVKSKYFIFNKERDFSGGYLEHMEYRGDELCISQGFDRGRFITRVLDSREKSTEWHRMGFNSRMQLEISCKVMVFAGDTLEFACRGTVRNVMEVIEDRNLTFEEKLKLMNGFLAGQSEGHRDILLHQVTGRYLWIAFEVYSLGSKTADRLRDIRIYFPRQSWLSYLPEVYQSEDKTHFLERYLAVFQTLYEEITYDIGQVPFLLDTDSTQTEYLKWLAGWLDIAGDHMWSPNQLRSLVKHGVKLYQRRGTREGMLTLIRLYTGGICFLVEPCRLPCFQGREQQKTELTRLYGMDPYTLTVIVKKEDVPTQKEYKALLRVIDEMKPAQMGLNLVVLEYFLFLGGHSYLGLNSALGEYRLFALDGLAMLPFSAIKND